VPGALENRTVDARRRRGATEAQSSSPAICAGVVVAGAAADLASSPPGAGLSHPLPEGQKKGGPACRKNGSPLTNGRESPKNTAFSRCAPGRPFARSVVFRALQ
jgi:hypothetical protein